MNRLSKIEEMKNRLRSELSTRIDDRDIVDILEVLQNAEEENARLREALTEISTPYKGSDIPVLSVFQMFRRAKSALEETK